MPSFDYVAWALGRRDPRLGAPQELGPGTVTVRFVRDNDGTGSAIIPDSTEGVQSYIEPGPSQPRSPWWRPWPCR